MRIMPPKGAEGSLRHRSFLTGGREVVMKEAYTVILSIAGSDPCGGAGLQCDVKTAMLMGVHAATAVTAVTVQNSYCTSAVFATDAAHLEMQIDAVVMDTPIAAVKIGMLPTADQVRTVAQCLYRHNLSNIVVDTVGIPTSGRPASSESTCAFDALLELLLPVADIITPNIPEARVLASCSEEPSSELSLPELCYEVLRVSGAKHILLKGGHSSDSNVNDILMTASGMVNLLTSKRINTDNAHGTGCALSTAIACGLAQGKDLLGAVTDAERLVHKLLLRGANRIYGDGRPGPLGFV